LGIPECRKVLAMVGELHARGYELLRIMPGMSPSGVYWRTAITAAKHITRENGARMDDLEAPAAYYSIAAEDQFFGWDDADDAGAVRLADLFVARCAEVAEEARGSDPAYVEWYRDMLARTDPDHLPVAYTDSSIPDDGLRTFSEDGRDITVPLPPPGLGRLRAREFDSYDE